MHTFDLPPELYVKTIVERYKGSPTIFAWELMNEARCLSDTLPAGPSCVPGSNTLRTWYEQQSDFVRSLCVSRTLSQPRATDAETAAGTPTT